MSSLGLWTLVLLIVASVAQAQDAKDAKDKSVMSKKELTAEVLAIKGAVAGLKGLVERIRMEDTPCDASCITAVSTPGTYAYKNIWTADSKIPDGLGTTLTFTVRTCNDAHVLLTASPQGSANGLYEIVIGGWANSVSVIRTSKQQHPAPAGISYRPLDCNEYRKFYVSWAGGEVKVGGFLPSGAADAPFLTYKDPAPFAVRYAYVSGWDKPTEWRFNTPCDA